MKRIGILMLICWCCAAIAMPQAVKTIQPRIIMFDAPGAGTAGGAGTTPIGINAMGVIFGWYTDNNYANHGFVRWPNGKFQTIDAPGASDTGDLNGTFVYAVNNWGVVVGAFKDVEGVFHGFRRDPDGKMKILNDPDAGKDAGQGTQSMNINDVGTITGTIIDGSNKTLVFLLSREGKYTTFDIPGATGVITPSVYGLNQLGMITGYYTDGNGLNHAFLRMADGDYKTFDDPKAGTESGQGTQAWTINAWGVAAGTYIDADGVQHGFVRTLNGKMRSFDPLNSLWTTVWANNAEGAVTGYYWDGNANRWRSYLRLPFGTVVEFDGPGEIATLAFGINLTGLVTGQYAEENLVWHGFLAFPPAMR